jgi:hypothetical protein
VQPGQLQLVASRQQLHGNPVTSPHCQARDSLDPRASPALCLSLPPHRCRHSLIHNCTPALPPPPFHLTSSSRRVAISSPSLVVALLLLASCFLLAVSSLLTSKYFYCLLREGRRDRSRRPYPSSASPEPATIIRWDPWDAAVSRYIRA